MTLTFNKFNKFALNIGKGAFNLGTDTLKVALSNTAPSATNEKLADITQISYTNLSSTTITTTSFTETSGVASLVLADLKLTASGGSVAPFRYVVVYSDTATNKELIGYVDIGSSITLGDTDEYNIKFGATEAITIQ